MWAAKHVRWVAKYNGSWVAKYGEWAAKYGRWVAKLVARLLVTATLWVRIQTSLKKYKMGDISKKVANTL